MRGRPLVVLLAVLATLTGCVGVPEVGPVVETRSEGDVSPGSGIYFDPRPPQKGASRPDIVRGFLEAMQATPIETKSARAFLTHEASASWDPQEQTITYAVPPAPQETADGVSVRLSDPHHLDSRGAWQGTLPARERTIEFPMVFEGGEWRIDRAPDALIVPAGWFEERFRQVSLYFFDPTATMLVPEPVYVPRGQTLATTLTRSLLMGPRAGQERVTQSFVPRGLDVAVGVAVSENGVADIPLTGDAGPPLTAKAVQLMMAQFAWTLRQEPSVEGIRVSIDGQPLPLPGGVSSYRVDGGAEFDPAGFQASPLLYGLRDGVLVSGTPAALTPVSGGLGSRAYGVRSVGVNLQATRAAGVGAGGTSLLVGPISAADKGRVRTVVSGATDLLRPAWDVADRIWLVDRAPGGARVSYVEGTRIRDLDVPGISGRLVRMFLVSRDGTRLVAVVRNRAGTDSLVVSRIEHAGGGRVLGATRAQRISSDEPQLPIRAVAWRTPTSVALLSPFTPTVAQVLVASVDGSPIGQDSLSPTVEGSLRRLAGSPRSGEELYGVGSDGLFDIFSSDLKFSPLEGGVSAVVYVG